MAEFKKILDRGVYTTNCELEISSPSSHTMILKLSGDWVSKQKFPPLENIFNESRISKDIRQIHFKTHDLEHWDMGLLIYLRKIRNECIKRNIEMMHEGLPISVNRLLNLSLAVPNREDTKTAEIEEDFLHKIGNVSIGVTISLGELLDFIGECVFSFGKFLRGKAKFRHKDFIEFLQESGPNALPIVILINFLIGIILAFVGAVQLQQFGAQIYVANLVGIAMVREVSPLMTAIIATGRSGASYAAQLGTMVVNEEIDALQTMGFSPIDFLVLPRMLALSIMMPLLVLFADFIGILGGATIGMSMLDLSFTQYFEQTREALNPLHFLLGLIKSIIYGILIAIAGCLQGLKCGRSASAVGTATTAAVVMGIVYIIVAAAITTVIYSILGL